ncbi:MAG: protein translocase subunit SecD [Rhodoluna sp.]|nr:protein translocase subunit SecD [Rhodoluna sp.]
MAESTFKKSARKKLIWLVALISVLAGVIGAAPSLWGAKEASFFPQLALDLQGGTSMILKPIYQAGSTGSAEQLQQAVEIIRQRIDSTGVSEAQITTSGDSAIVVSVPGDTSSDLENLISQSAQMAFRPVLVSSSGATAIVAEKGKTTAPIATGSAKPTDPSDLNVVDAATQAAYEKLVCDGNFKILGTPAADKPLVTCNRGMNEKYILGPVEVDGTEISDAQANTETVGQVSTNKWLVNLTFKSKGSAQFADTTTRLYGLTDPRNRFAVTLDGIVVTAPAVQGVITGGQAQITGSFTQAEATSLANQLKYGSLPIQFEVNNTEKVSATLGVASLQAGLLAGLIGLILVVVYSLLQYRALAAVTMGSLVVAAVLTYLVICYLSWRSGYRLSLAGVAGLIVAIGITVDSFIVYFERVRDELRDGRALGGAVEAGWKRAIRTIMVSDGVSLLAAVTLFLLTVGNVRGFAFTLLITTLIDLVVVFLFTHPILQLISTNRFFLSGSKWSGFDSKALVSGGYVGRGKFRAPEDTPRAKRSTNEAIKRQTIAERKNQEGSN